MPIDDTITNLHKDPPVILDGAYAERLHGLASAAMDRVPDVATRLLEEIERAEVLPSDEVPPSVVNIGSTVTFRDDSNTRLQTVTLVLPPDADIGQQRVSVLTPIGAALIGLTEGASIAWKTRTGETRALTIIRVSSPGA